MSFKSRDLMVDILPAKNPFANGGLVLCGEITAGGKAPGGDDDDEEIPGPCVDATAIPGGCSDATARPDRFTPTEAGLAMLRHQLREALSQPAAGSF